MPKPRKSWWRKVRRAGGWCRKLVLWTLLLLTGAFIYLNTIGLPPFLKAPLQAELRDRGIELEYERLRLRWTAGIVAESVNLGSSRLEHGPQFYVDEVQIRLDTSSLLHGRIKVESLFLRRGKLALPIGTGENPEERFVVDGILSMLKFHPDGRWELDQFRADCLGARLQLTGVLTNAAFLRRTGRPGATTNAASVLATPLWKATLQQANRIAGGLQFSNIPTLNLVVQGDVLDPASFNARLTLNATGARTPWGTLGKLLLSAQFNQPPSGTLVSHSQLRLEADDARTPWGQMKQLAISAALVQSFTNPVPSDVAWDISLTQLRTLWIDVPASRITARTERSDGEAVLLRTSGAFTTEACTARGARWGRVAIDFSTAHALTNTVPLEAGCQGRVEGIHSEALTSGDVAFSARMIPRPGSNPGPGWAWWGGWAPYAIDLDIQTPSLTASGIEARDLRVSAAWEAPRLTLRSLQASLLEGGLALRGTLDVDSRRVSLEGGANINPKLLGHVLDPGVMDWLGQFSWNKPPEVTLDVRAALPAWADAAPDWERDVLPTVKLEATFRGSDAAYMDVPIQSAQGRLRFEEGVLRIPELHVERPEGSVDASYWTRPGTREFQWVVHRASIDLRALRPALSPEARLGLDMIQFSVPPVLSANVQGCYTNPQSIGFTAHAALTNVVIRGEPIDSVVTQADFTNQVFLFTKTEVWRNGERAGADAVGLDIPGQMLTFTNAHGRFDPGIIVRIIGEKTAEAIEPYQFAKSPDVTLNGRIATVGNDTDDAIFDVKGEEFTWWRFHVPEIQGRVHWRGAGLTISNLQASFYGGRLEGSLTAKLPRDAQHKISFTMNSEGADLHELVGDLSPGTNHLSGKLDTRLVVESMDPSDLGSWEGFGNARLVDGFLWDWPLFGLFSPVLNTVMPGIGSSRATAGTASFTITNSVIRTRDMDIHASTMRLKYSGTVDFEGRVQARVEAEILRDAWLLGRLVSLAMSPLTKILVYRVTGTLSEPKAEPLHVPKLLLAPLHPVETLKGIFNAPPPKESPPRKDVRSP
jgi:hypothetical protein